MSEASSALRALDAKRTLGTWTLAKCRDRIAADGEKIFKYASTGGWGCPEPWKHEEYRKRKEAEMQERK